MIIEWEVDVIYLTETHLNDCLLKLRCIWINTWFSEQIIHRVGKREE